jgi:hypothetical protein
VKTFSANPLINNGHNPQSSPNRRRRVKNVHGVIEQIGQQPKNELRDTAEAAAKVLLRERLARLQELATAA